MKPRWILLFLLASLVLAWLTHWYQTKAAWTVTLKPGSSLLGISDDRQIIFLDENTEPTIYPLTITKRSLTTGQLLQQITLEKNDAPWHDSANVRISPDQRYLIMTEGHRRDSQGIAVLYDLKSGKPVKQWSLKPFYYQTIVFSRDSKYLILGRDSSDKAIDDHLVRILNLEKMTEQNINFPVNGIEGLIQVLPTDDVKYLAVKVSKGRHLAFRVYSVRLINCQTNKVLGEWECWNEPLMQTAPNSFGFQVEIGNSQQQLVVVHASDQPGKPKPAEEIVFTNIDDPEILYRFRDIVFHRFCEYEPSRLTISNVNSSSTFNGLGLQRMHEPTLPIPWLHKYLVNWNILRTTYQFRWLDIASKTCSEPVSVSDHGMTEVLPSGVINLDNHQQLRYFRYPSRWRWYITAGMASLPFVAMMFIVLRTCRRKLQAS